MTTPEHEPTTASGHDPGSELEQQDRPGRTGPRPAWLRLGAVGAVAAGVVLAGTFFPGELRLPGIDSTATDATHTDGPTTDAAGTTTDASGTPVPLAAATSAALGCPGGPGSGSAADPMAVVAATIPDAATEGLAELAPTGTAELVHSGDADGAVPIPSAPLQESLSGEVAALAVATGSQAPGLVAGALGLAEQPGDRWLALTACTPPAEEQWLLGGGGGPGQSEEIVLTNPGPDAATVQVEVWGERGPVEVTGATGLVVPGHGRTSHLIDALATGVESPVVRVTASGAPVSAHLVTQWRDGTTDLGGDVTPSAAAPDLDLVVPAVPRGEGEDAGVVLRLLAPEEAAVVDLTALTTDGAVALAGHVTSLEPGQVQDVPLEEMPEGLLGLRVRSTAPVTAAAVVAVAPTSDEPIETTGDEDAADDGAGATEDPDSADATERPDSAEVTAGPDAAEVTEGPDAAPLVRPAGELTWVPGVRPSTTPVGMGLPDRATVPGATSLLALTTVDATGATVVWVDGEGGPTREVLDRVPNDTTLVLEVPEGARAVWVLPAAGGAVTASVHVTGADERGPYLSASTLPALDWHRAVTEVRVRIP